MDLPSFKEFLKQENQKDKDKSNEKNSFGDAEEPIPNKPKKNQ